MNHDDILRELGNDEARDIKIPFNKALVDENNVLIAYLQDTAVVSDDYRIVKINAVEDSQELDSVCDELYSMIPYKKVVGKSVQTDATRKRDFDKLKTLIKNGNRVEIDSLIEKHKIIKKGGEKNEL